MKIFVLIQKTNKIFVCEIIIFQLNFEGYIIWKTDRHVKLNFLATVKKLPKSLDLSARPETSSIIIILSNLLFYPKMLSLSDLFSLKIFDYNPKFNNILWVQKFSRNIKTRSYLMSSFFWKYNFCYPQNILNFSKHVVFSKFWTKAVLPHPVCPKTSIFPGNFPSYKYFSIFILDLICAIELFELSLCLNFRYQCIFCRYLDLKINIWNFVTIFVHKDLTFHLTKSFFFHS